MTLPAGWMWDDDDKIWRHPCGARLAVVVPLGWIGSTRHCGLERIPTDGLSTQVPPREVRAWMQRATARWRWSFAWRLVRLVEYGKINISPFPFELKDAHLHVSGYAAAERCFAQQHNEPYEEGRYKLRQTINRGEIPW